MHPPYASVRTARLARRRRASPTRPLVSIRPTVLPVAPRGCLRGRSDQTSTNTVRRRTLKTVNKQPRRGSCRLGEEGQRSLVRQVHCHPGRSPARRRPLDNAPRRWPDIDLRDRGRRRAPSPRSQAERLTRGESPTVGSRSHSSRHGGVWAPWVAHPTCPSELRSGGQLPPALWRLSAAVSAAGNCWAATLDSSLISTCRAMRTASDRLLGLSPRESAPGGSSVTRHLRLSLGQADTPTLGGWRRPGDRVIDKPPDKPLAAP